VSFDVISIVVRREPSPERRMLGGVFDSGLP
jgi:hypothetical protein